MSKFKEEHTITSAIDPIIDTSYYGGYNEVLDLETLKLLEEIEMTATMNSVQTQKMLGQLNVGDNNTFNATFTEEGSSAIQTMSYDGDYLIVTFRGRETSYQYMASDDVLSDLIDELHATLVDGEGSMGSLINRLVRENKLQLV